MNKAETIAALKAAIETPKRKSLSAKDREKIFAREHGVCHLCKVTIDPVREKWQADHVIAREFTGKDDLEEFKPAHVSCHKGKTKDDVMMIRKAQRIRRKHMGAKPQKPEPRYRKKMNGDVVDTRTNKVVNRK